MLTSGPIENILVDAVKAKYAEQSDDEVSVLLHCAYLNQQPA